MEHKTFQMIVLYQISSKNTAHIYVGISSNLKRRIQKHKRELKLNKHHNYILQRVYNKYGLNDLQFEVLQEFENREQACIAEIEFIKHNTCVNTTKGGDGGDIMSNHIDKDEIIKKIQVTKRKRGIVLSEQFKNNQRKPFNSKVHDTYYCKKCNKSIAGRSNYLRYHGDMCGKPRKDLVKCPYCHKVGAKTGMVRWHFENCKHKS